MLAITDLHVGQFRKRADVPIVAGISLAIEMGETVALVGESGAGKTMCALAVMGLLPDGLRITGGSIRLSGDELVGARESKLRGKRGGEMAMIFQDPLSSLHPAYRVGDQIVEAIRTHGRVNKRDDARSLAVTLLRVVGVPEPNVRVREYPHQLSGGMRQRVMIAMAMANDPRLLIADEATTALDVTVQAQVLDVLREAQVRTGAAMLIVTHDLGVVAGIADRVVVMYAGRIVEAGSVHDVLTAPVHPYTQGLLRAVPRLDTGGTGPLVAIPGAPPNPGAWPQGCPFHPRCAHADERCTSEVPNLESVLTAAAAAHDVACHHPQ